MNPNFEEYSLEELKDIEAQIDRKKYPERYSELSKLIRIKEQSSEIIYTPKIETFGFKDIYEYFKHGFYVRITSLAFTLLSYYWLLESKPVDFLEAKLIGSIILGVGGIIYSWNSGEK